MKIFARIRAALGLNPKDKPTPRYVIQLPPGEYRFLEPIEIETSLRGIQFDPGTLRRQFFVDGREVEAEVYWMVKEREADRKLALAAESFAFLVRSILAEPESQADAIERLLERARRR